MERRTALALAVAAAGTALASSAAFAINAGLLLHEDSKPSGVLTSSVIDASFGADPSQVTVAVDDPWAGTGSNSQLDQSYPDQPFGTAGEQGYDDDSTYDDHEEWDDYDDYDDYDDDESDHESDHDSESTKLPGHDDDD